MRNSPSTCQCHLTDLSKQLIISNVKVRSGQVIIFAVCAVPSLSFQAVVLLTKTVINHQLLYSTVV